MATTATSALSSSTSAALASSPAALAAANKASAQKLITSLNAGSGVDVSALAQNLVDAERAPQENAIKAKITKNESRISGYSALSFVLDGVKTALTALKDQNSFSSLVANNTNTSAFSVTAAATAVEGSHSVNVLQLAKAQRTVTEGLASPTASLNGGKAITFSLTVGGTSTDIKLPMVTIHLKTWWTSSTQPKRVSLPSWSTPAMALPTLTKLCSRVIRGARVHLA